MSKTPAKKAAPLLELSATIQDYLALLYVMERDQMPVVGAHLAELLAVTPPTVANTLKRMTRDGLITMDKNGTHLTQAGWDAAQVVVRRHMLMEWMMVSTLPWSRLHAEAHQLEHAISALTETSLLEQLQHPQTCPHGNPLPGSEAAAAHWVPLMEIPAGSAVIIRRIHELAEANAPLLAYLEAKHILPGTEARVLEVLPFNQTITIEVERQPVTLGYTAALSIFVETR